ncbi:MAG: hypothetical protein AB8B59_19015 [Maribacter sp.]
MKLQTERKVKFWLTSIAKVLVIALIAFKLTPYVLGTAENSKTAITKKNKAIKVKEVSTPTVRNTRGIPSNGSKEDSVEKTQHREMVSVSDTVNLSLPSDVKGVEKSLGIFIFDENSLDRTVAKQLEKTILQEYQIGTVSPTPNKLQLLNGIMTGLGNLEHVCIGTVSYVFKDTNGKFTCILQIDFDTYNVRTGFKIKNRSASLTRYGIGFSKEQAKDVAIGKINSI